MTFPDAARATGGTLASAPAPTTTFSGVSIDSRSVSEGEAFVAVAGDRFDGHDYCAAAASAGAALLVVSRDVGPLPRPVPLLAVEDTRAALAAIARGWRDAVAPRVVAITGSMGKTTTKELTTQLCRRLGATHSTRGNFNNEIGLPLTLLAMPEQTALLVVEMGMNAAGEIAQLAGVARPDVGLVTNVAPVHLEGLGSIEGVARAKGELLDAIAAAGGERWAVAPSAEPLLEPHLAPIPAARRLRFGRQEGDDVRVLDAAPRGMAGLALRLSIAGSEQALELPLVGQHNALNAAAAAAVASCLGLPPAEIAAGLAEPLGDRLGHRSALRRVGRWRVLDDCYNANPRATCAALDTIVELAAGSPVQAVLGEMLELGEHTARYHREVGAHAATLPLATLVVVNAPPIAAGARAAGMPAERVLEVEDAEAAAAALGDSPASSRGGWLLVKGSRGARLEALLEQLAEGLTQEPPVEPPRRGERKTTPG